MNGSLHDRQTVHLHALHANKRPNEIFEGSRFIYWKREKGHLLHMTGYLTSTLINKINILDCVTEFILRIKSPLFLFYVNLLKVTLHVFLY